MLTDQPNRIPIGQLSSHRAAQAFSDYLKSQNISAWTETEQSSFIIYIDDPSTEDFATAQLGDFLNNPSDPKYLEASWQHGASNLSIKSVSSGQSASVGIKQFLKRSGTMTKTLVGLSILVTLVTSFGSNLELTKYLMIADITQYRGGLPELMAGQLWRLVTPIFLHFMIIHILFNMMWLWDLGGNVEKIQSPQFLLFFVISIGIMSNLIQYLSSGPAFGGMSGVVYGLLGYSWIRSRKVQSGYQLPQSIVIFMLAWLVLGYTGVIGAIGNAAHLSGLILGMAYGFAWNIYD